MDQENYDKLPPCDVDAEASLLGSLMIEPTMMDQVQASIAPDSFFQADHQIIFRVMADLWKTRRTGMDAVTLRAEMAKRGVLEEVGGSGYLANILNTVPHAANGLHYAEIVRDTAVLRRLIQEANRTLRTCYGARHGDAGEIVQRHLSAVTDIVRAGDKGNTVKIDSLVMDVATDLESPDNPVVMTGLTALDEVTGGVSFGEQIIIGARPSIGKSTFCRQLAMKFASAGIPVGFVSLEESQRKIGRNLISAVAQIENRKVRNRSELTLEDRRQINNSLNRFQNLPLYINDRVRRLDDIRAQAAVMKARHGIKVLIIDHLALVNAPGQTEYERVSGASRGISELIKDLNVVGFVASQLSRALGQRDNKRATMTDLRSSGEIEQNADQIWFLHREDYYHDNDKDYVPCRQLEVNVAKNRDSTRGGVITMRSELQYQRFTEMPQQAGGEEVPF